MVLQDTWLFSGTVFENLAYGKKDATMEEVVAAAKAAKIHHTISQLPQGYDTVIDDDGVNLSKGQKQLLTIARRCCWTPICSSWMKRPPMWIPRRKRRFSGPMQKLMKGKTCFVIAHRLSTIKMQTRF